MCVLGLITQEQLHSESAGEAQLHMQRDQGGESHKGWFYRCSIYDSGQCSMFSAKERGGDVAVGKLTQFWKSNARFL